MLTVPFDLPAGWVELPRPGSGGKGRLRRNPYLARTMQVGGMGANG